MWISLSRPAPMTPSFRPWDNCGGVGKTPVTITVEGNTLPPPKFLYSSDYAGSKVYEYLVNASTGAITATSQGSIATPSYPERIASDEGGFRLYVTSTPQSGSVLSAYFINRSNGSLQAVPGSAGSLGTGVPTAVVVHPSGDFGLRHHHGWRPIPYRTISTRSK